MERQLRLAAAWQNERGTLARLVCLQVRSLMASAKSASGTSDGGSSQGASSMLTVENLTDNSGHRRGSGGPGSSHVRCALCGQTALFDRTRALPLRQQRRRSPPWMLTCQHPLPAAPTGLASWPHSDPRRRSGSGPRLPAQCRSSGAGGRDHTVRRHGQVVEHESAGRTWHFLRSVFILGARRHRW